MKGHVLFVDDDPAVTSGLRRSLHKEPYKIYTASSANEALDLLAKQPIDVIVSDEKMPGMSGTDFLARVCRDYPDTIRMILTGHANLETFTRAVKDGQIYRFFIKPCNEVDLAITIRQALEQKKLMSESWRLMRVLNEQSTLLQDLEKKHPGITKVKRNAEGVVIVDNPQADAETLIQKLMSEAERGEKFLKNVS
jgi:DNA-binding NtrC family response regulator